MVDITDDGSGSSWSSSDSAAPGPAVAGKRELADGAAAGPPAKRRRNAAGGADTTGATDAGIADIADDASDEAARAQPGVERVGELRGRLGARLAAPAGPERPRDAP